MKQEKRTGTITFHAPINNGAFFQAYALQQTIIQQLGYANEIIDYRSAAQKSMYRVLTNGKSLGSIIKNAATLVHYRELKVRENRFAGIRKQMLRCTEEVSDLEGVLRQADTFDTLICGSDQIWNTKLRDFSEAYYLPGIGNKISYAVSMGKTVTKKSTDILNKYCGEFSSLSFRECSTIDMLRQQLPQELAMEQVLDPVFLLPVEKWREFPRGTVKRIPKRYIFLYSINYMPETMRVAQAVARKLNIPIVTPFGGYSIGAGIRAERFGAKVDYAAGPAEFLEYLQNAEIVLSDSFHGIVFSILFHKNFYKIHHLDQSGKPVRDERLDDLLESLGVEGRSIDANSIDLVDLERTSDWETVDARTAEKRHNSLEWLERAIMNNTTVQKSEQVQFKHQKIVLVPQKEQCCGCGACAQVCPRNAIRMEADREGFLYPVIDDACCVGCGQCLAVCAFKVDQNS